MAIIPSILFYICTLFLGVSIMIVMFKTSFACEVLELLKFIGFKKNSDFYDIGYGTALSPKNWTNDDWQNFCNTKLNFLGRLFTCKYCFSCHVIFWSNIITSIIVFALGYPISLLTVLFAIVTQLPLLHLIFSKIK